MLRTGDAGKLCYTTLAIGYEYNKHAKQLSRDIDRLSPNVPFVILTDRPKFFCTDKHVIAVKHNVQSVGIYHDKLDCVEHCLKNFDCCIYIDADCRLIENLALSRCWKPGLTAKTCWSLAEYLVPKRDSLYESLRYRLACEVAEEFGIVIDKCQFVYEGIFIIRKDNEKEIEFLRTWKQIRDYFEINEVFDGEGVAIGLAACKASMKIYHYNSGYPEEGVNLQIKDVYKDKLFYKFLLHKNTEILSSDLQERILEFDRQRKQIANLPLWRKLIRKIANPVTKKIRFVRLKTKRRLISPILQEGRGR